MPRGENSSRRGQLVPATIVDHDNQVQFRIVTSMQGNLIITMFAIMMALIIILMLFTFKNKTDIEQIERKVSPIVEEQIQ